MASMGQYMTGYPTNVAQMGMNANPPMRYQLPGDPNKMLSGGRHKKEVKRRTKTGCLTCRKRRIKVRIFVHLVVCFELGEWVSIHQIPGRAVFRFAWAAASKPR
jgi:hypothetical protein